MSKNIIFRSTDSQAKTLVEHFGIGSLWASTVDFEISASACVTLTELRSRWTCVTEKFIADKMGNNGLPLAGLINHFADEDVYQCRPVFGYFEYLMLPEKHPDYANRFPRSYQCFAQEHSIMNFVLPLSNVEAYEKAHPEVLRPVVRESDTIEGAIGTELLREILSRLSSLEEHELITNRKQYLAAVLYASGMKARVLHTLLSGKADVEENGRQERAREWRNQGLAKLNFDLDELKSKKII